MKRTAMVVFLVCLLAAAGALAESFYVLNPGAWDQRLNLRFAPGKNAESLGRYYTGVRVESLGAEGEWRYVRIACGTGGTEVRGYMMDQYLTTAEGRSMAAAMPRVTAGAGGARITDDAGYELCTLPAGEAAYVMAYCGARLHLLLTDGTMGYVKAAEMSALEEPELSERILIERIAVASGGSALYDAPGGREIARLAGGAFIEGGMVLAQDGGAFVSLGDLRGWLPADGFTWTDNNADCDVEYPVWETDTEIIEQLGAAEDGRLILRRLDSILGAARTELADALPQGARELSRDGSYYLYTAALEGGCSDAYALSVYEDAARRNGYYPSTAQEAGYTLRVKRLYDPQYRHAMLFVVAVDAKGDERTQAALDEGRHVIDLADEAEEEGTQAELDPADGELISFGANG
ncbi:MAG: SH3 domain-containing protein [Clostridia bacterium]|nr:SH3 domain-containing protein [Clostridia bacterium]